MKKIPQQAFWFGTRLMDAQPFLSLFEQITAVSFNTTSETHPCITSLGSLEAIYAKRNPWYANQVEEVPIHTELQHKIAQFLATDGILIPFSSSPKLYQFCQQHSYRYLGITPEVRNQFESKSHITKLVQTLGLPQIRAHYANIGGLNYAQLSDTLDSDGVVIQRDYSVSGSGTFLIQNDADLQALKQQQNAEEVVKIAPLLHCPVASIAAVVAAETSFLGPVTQHIAHSQVISRKWGVHSGNVIHAEDWHESCQAIRSHTKAICDYLCQHGYRGMVNFNFLTQGPFLIDINPRFMSHMRILHDIESDNEVAQLSRLHLLSMLEADCSAEKQPTSGESKFPHSYTMLVLYSLEAQETTVSNAVKPGLYEQQGEALLYQSKRCDLAAISNDNQLLILDPTPVQGARIASGAMLCKVHLKTSAVDSATGHLTDKAQALVRRVYALYGLTNSSILQPPNRLSF